MRVLLGAAPVIVLALGSAGCGELLHPCRDGVLRALVIVGPGSGMTASGPGYDGLGELGTLDEPHPLLLECTAISALSFQGPITTLSAFDRVRAIGSLQFLDGAVVDGPLTGFPELKAIGALLVEGGAGDLDIFRRVEAIGTITMRGGGVSLIAPELKSLDDLYARVAGFYAVDAPRLEEIPGRFFLENFSVVSMDGFSALNFIGEMTLQSVFPLSVLGLNALREVGGDLEVANTGLESWNGLSALELVRGDVNIAGNDNISSEPILEWADGVSIEGSVRICGNGGNNDIPRETCPPFDPSR